MIEQYLILHKVRGEPAYDIAHVLSEDGTALDPGPWWIISTSGHRAYPFRQWALRDTFAATHDTIPDDWPDHCEYEFDNRKVAGPISTDLASIAEALLPKVEPIRRRF